MRRKTKKECGVSEQDSLLIYKVDIIKEDMKIPKIEYEVYYPLNGKNLEKLNLSKCEDIKINLMIPIIIDKDEIDKHNTSSGYYKNICYKSTTEYGTDISLQDRKKEYAEKDLYVCEENCNFKEYDLKTQKAVCSCDVKNSFLDSFADININSTKLLNNIVDIKNVINLKIMKCYALLFQDEKGIIKNIGFYVISPVILFHIISIIIFYVIEKKIFFKKIEDIINVREDKNKHNNEVVIESNNNESIIYQKNEKEKKIKKFNLISSKKKNQKKRKKKKYNKNINIVQTNPNNDKKNNNIINDNSNSKIGVVNSFKNVHEINNKYMNNKFILDYNIYELNNLSYADALKFDKRNFIIYYFSLLKTNHLLINSFYPYK